MLLCDLRLEAVVAVARDLDFNRFIARQNGLFAAAVATLGGRLFGRVIFLATQVLIQLGRHCPFDQALRQLFQNPLFSDIRDSYSSLVTRPITRLVWP